MNLNIGKYSLYVFKNPGSLKDNLAKPLYFHSLTKNEMHEDFNKDYELNLLGINFVLQVKK